MFAGKAGQFQFDAVAGQQALDVAQGFQVGVALLVLFQQWAGAVLQLSGELVALAFQLLFVAQGGDAEDARLQFHQFRVGLVEALLYLFGFFAVAFLLLA